MSSNLEEYSKKLSTVKRIIKTALGKVAPDLCLRNCNLVNVYTGEIMETDVSISSGRVASIEKCSTTPKRVLDCRRYYAVPGLIDGHMHLDSTLLVPSHLAKILIPHGVTTVLTDPLIIANVLGFKGVCSLLKDAWCTPLKTYIQISSRVPNVPGLETTGSELSLREVLKILKWEKVVSLGEMDPSKIVPPKDEYLLKILAAKKVRKISIGSAAGLSGMKLVAFAASGITDDHECVTAQEALERLRSGMKVVIREGSTERNLEALVKVITEEGQDQRNFLFCTDDKHPNDIVREGSIDYNVRKAISLGLDPVKAIQIATVNCAEHFRLEEDIGSITPGRYADIVLVHDLKDFRPEMVIANGEIVAKNGEFLGRLRRYRWPKWSMDTFKMKRKVVPTDFKIISDKEKQTVRVIQIIEDQIINKEIKFELNVKDGQVIADINNDVLKIACVERHKRTGNIAIAFVKGFELKEGAIASSFAHDHYNIVVVGTNDEDMAKAVNAINAMRGGLVAVNGGKILEKLELRIAGLMSTRPPDFVIRQLERLNRAARRLGSKLHAPFMTLSFVPLPTMPELGLTDKGLIDVWQGKIVDVKINKE